MPVETASEPPPTALDKRGLTIRQLFDGIAGHYDLLNHLLSMNLDRRWRERAIDRLAPRPHGCYLDACTGTGDLGLALAARLREEDGARVYGSDFSLSMLESTRHKPVAADAPRPRWLAGDTLRLPFADGTFDGALVGFGIRNVDGLDQGLSELRRVLRPGGQLVLLEFTRMQNRMLRPFAEVYCRWIVPCVGNLVSRSRERAYSYLQASMKEWPDGERLAARMRDAGFETVEWRALFPGIVALHHGRV